MATGTSMTIHSDQYGGNQVRAEAYEGEGVLFLTISRASVNVTIHFNNRQEMRDCDRVISDAFYTFEKSRRQDEKILEPAEVA